MTVAELMKRLDDMPLTAEVGFYDRDMPDGPPVYPILSVEEVHNDKLWHGCVLTDDTEGVHRR